MNYWLFKSEPGAYSIDDLKKDRTTFWDGVRNYQARNLMRDDIKKGDMVLFYHSNAKPPGVVGLAVVSKNGSADVTAFDPKNKYFDSKSNPENPTWIGVTIRHKKTFKNIIPLDDLKASPKFEDMMVTRRGARLSVQPVSKKHFDFIVKMGEKTTRSVS